MKTFRQLRDEFHKTARQELKNSLAQCTDGQQYLFAQMYARGNLDLSIDEIVDSMDWERIDWAMQQVQRTLEEAQ